MNRGKEEGKEGNRRRERGRERKISSIHWLTIKMTAKSRPGPSQNQEAGTSFGFLPRWQWPGYLGHLGCARGQLDG